VAELARERRCGFRPTCYVKRAAYRAELVIAAVVLWLRTSRRARPRGQRTGLCGVHLSIPERRSSIGAA